ncbi:DinB family protein [Paenibacillus thiaminolyticus]|uniref:DinB family protein n=1 Tax=Paenibacillus thiaminolyticus TaxID=49283 RepID=UPI003D2B2907
MTYSSVAVIWNTLHERFYNMANSLPEEALGLRIGAASVGYMLRHNAEVEYLFAEWFFRRPLPPGLEILTSRGPAAGGERDEFLDRECLLALLRASNQHVVEAMRELPEEAWRMAVDSPMGASTPLEAVSRLLYHTGLHAGQISLIQKHAQPAGQTT